jgi:hypothetical protein
MARVDRTGPYEVGTNPTLAQLSKNWMRNVRLAIRTHAPATVVAYDPATQRATVTVDILPIAKVFTQLTPGVDPNLTNQVQPLPPFVLTNIPVVWSGTGDGTGYLTFPLVPGSTGHLEVMDRGLQTWLDRVTQVPVDPIQSATHALGDSVFVPGLTDNLHRISVPTDMVGARLHHDAQVTLEAAIVKLGANATQFAVLGQDLINKLNELIGVFNTHTHIVAGTCPPGGGALTGGTAAPTTDTQTPATPVDFLSTKVQVQ